MLQNRWRRPKSAGGRPHAPAFVGHVEGATVRRASSAGRTRGPVRAGLLAALTSCWRQGFVFATGLEGDLEMGIQAINARNQFRGKVKEIIRGDVVSEVDVETPAGIVTSVITTRSVDELGLKPGSVVIALVKSTEVLIATLV
jgi:molybdopterin-binding protein